MRDAYGGIVNIAIIVVLIVIISGFLAFGVNYNKAFNVKNKTITIIEQNESCELEESNDCYKRIVAYMKTLGYNNSANLDEKDKPDGFNCKGRICIKENKETDAEKIMTSYDVITFVTIDIPIINRVLDGIGIFRVSGSTRVIIDYK